MLAIPSSHSATGATSPPPPGDSNTPKCKKYRNHLGRHLKSLLPFLFEMMKFWEKLVAIVCEANRVNDNELYAYNG
jgi:hypothetical protein